MSGNMTKAGLTKDLEAIERGAINGAYKWFFDIKNKPLLAYMKYDEKGNNQFFVAKAEQGE